MPFPGVSNPLLQEGAVAQQQEQCGEWKGPVITGSWGGGSYQGLLWWAKGWGSSKASIESS